MSHSYGLYQTFSSDTPIEDLSISDKREIKENFETLDTEQKKAVFFLIIEHAKLTDNYIYDPNNIQYPYDIFQNSDENIEFDLEKLPIKLKWILWKFNKILDKSK